MIALQVHPAIEKCLILVLPVFSLADVSEVLNVSKAVTIS